MPISNPVSNITDKQENNTRAPSKELRVNPETGTYESSKVEFRKPVYSGGKRVGYREVTDKGESKQVVVENPENVPQDIIKPQPKPTPKPQGLNITKEPLARFVASPAVAFAESTNQELYLDKPQKAQAVYREDKLSDNDYYSKAQRGLSELEYSAEREQQPVLRQAKSYAVVAGSAALAFATPFVKPVETAVGIGSMVLNPVGSARQIGTDVYERPAYAIGQLAGSAAFGEVVIKPIASKIPLKYEEVKLPTAEGETTVYRGLTYGDKGVVGLSEGKIVKGTPKISNVESIEFAKYSPETKFETKIARQVVETKYGAAELKKFDLSLDLAKETYGVKSEFISRFPEETKTLSPAGVQEVKLFAQKEKALAYGSFTAEAQLPKGELGLGRGIPKNELSIGDIDLQLNVNEGQAAIKAQKLTSSLRAAGEDVRISPDKPTLIESYREGEYRHAVDIHSLDVPLDADIPKTGALGMKFDQGTLKIENIKTMTLSEFGTRKAASTLTFRQEGFAPEPHRLKDIPDFVTSQEYLLQSKGAKLSSFEKLESLKNIYKEQGLLPDRPIESKVQLYSPSSQKPLGKIYPSYSPSVIPSKASPSTFSSPSLVSQPITSSSLANIRSPSLGYSTPVASPSVGSYSSASPSISPSVKGSPSISPSTKISNSTYSYGYTSQSPASPSSASPYNYAAYRSPLLNSISLPVPPGIGRPMLSPEIREDSKRKKGGKQKKKYRPDLIGRVLNIKAPKGTKKGVQSGFTVRGI